MINLPTKPILSLLLIYSLIHSTLTTAMSCTDTTRICTSYLAFTTQSNLTILQSMFDVYPQDITIEQQSNPNSNQTHQVFIKKNCSCASPIIHTYLTTTTFTIRSTQNDELVRNVVMGAYKGLAFLPNLFGRKKGVRTGDVVKVELFCGCSSGLWNYLMSYVFEVGDSVESLASRFGVSMDSIVSVNGILNPDNVTVGHLYYIPLNSVPGEPYPLETDLPPAPAPGLAADKFPENNVVHKTKVPYGWILGSVGIGLALIVITILVCISLRSSSCFAKSQDTHAKDRNGKIHQKFHILRTTSFCCGSRRYTYGEPSDRHMNRTTALGTDVYAMEKPVVFTYEEIIYSTDSFADSNSLGNGTYGSVYYGLLRDQEVAIKRMNALKTKEFMAEIKVLCRVHHSNLVELIGYAATDDELFLVYEYAQKGSVRSHLHNPQNKGQTSLSWIMRVQIALDTARGLEYIHEHTKTHYVHRDIKTSNILLDGAFRAKISDFGLAKLIGTNDDGEASVTKVVGTYGYLAPEYLTDGLATTKSDVYAFGVVLFEIISGKEAITRTEGTAMKNSERRSLASIMLAALKNCPDSMNMSSMKKFIDPNLMNLYPHDCLFKMAMLAKRCVDDDPILRPDMKQNVISLSQILLSSVEWEATLAGNSQVFSGLVQGR